MKKTLTILAVSLVFLASATMAMPAKAQAQTTAELQAQLNNLLNQLVQLQAELASLQNGTIAQNNFVFTGNLTVGSTGPAVSELQSFLVSRGFLTMPPGVAFGYFGPLTRAALARYQSLVGISPAVGFFGPLTRTNINAILATNNNGGLNGTGGSETGISTIGSEGIMTVTNYNAGLSSTVYAGQTMVPILGMRIDARQSDIAVQRVRVDLGNTSTLYNKILSRLYVTDGTSVLASLDLNPNTILRESNEYFAEITGFNFLVPVNTSRNLVIKADIYPAVDTTYQNTPFTIQLADNGVRGIDGAGIYQFGPQSGSSVSRNITAQQSLSESATLDVSVDASTPLSSEVAANSGINNNEIDRMPILTFDVAAHKDNVTITDLRVNMTKSGTGTANANTVYLFDGGTQIDNASVISGVAAFHNLDYTVPQNSTKVLTIKVDVTNANANPSVFTASIPVNGIIADNSIGDQLSSNSVTGSAIGYNIDVRSSGSEVALLSKSVMTSGVPQGSAVNNFSTSAMTANFILTVKAVGGDVTFGLGGSAAPAFNTSSFQIYRNGAVDNSLGNVQMALSYSVPPGATTAGLANAFIIPDGTTVTIPITVQLLGRRADNSALPFGLYAIGLSNINWSVGGVAQQTNFMAGDPNWKTNDVSFP